MDRGRHLECLHLLRGRRADNSTPLNMSRNSNRWFMDSPGVKYSGGKLVPHSDRQAGIASGGSKNRIKKDLRIGA